MTTIESDAPTLFDLLARRWETPSSVIAAVFSRTSASVAFVGADGNVWQASTADPESSTRRFRVAADTGRPTISPRRKAIKPLSPSALHDEVTCIAAYQDDAFALGCRSGRLLTMSATGRLSALEKGTRSIDAIASTRQDLFVASGGSVARYRSSGSTAQSLTSDAGHVAALAARSNAESVAWIGEKGLHLWASGATHLLDATIASAASRGAHTLAWSPCGRWLGIARGERELVLVGLEDQRVNRTIRLPDYPASVRALSWNAAGDLLATSGAFRVVTWDIGLLRAEADAAPTTRQTGRLGYVSVSTVACHPQKPLVAAGYENGAIVVAQAGRPDELVLRDAGSGPATTMCWSDDGHHLAFGTSTGEAIIATFPPTFFK